MNHALIRRSGRLVAAVALLAGPAALGAHAQTVLAYWNFDTATPATDTTVAQLASQLFTVTGGVNAGSALMSTTATTSVAYTSGGTTGLQAFAGTTINAVTVGSTNEAMAIQGGAGGSLVNNGSNLIFSVDSAGFQNLNVSMAIQATATGFQSDVLSYSTDGTNFTAFSAFTPLSSFALSNAAVPPVGFFNLSSVPALNNSSTPVYFEITFNGATGTSGNNRIDNVQITGSAIGSGGGAAPEPTTLALLPMGGVLSAAIFRRRSRKA